MQIIKLNYYCKYNNSTDLIANPQGRNLLEATQDLDLTIMNGSTVRDEDGDFTFIGPNGSITIDICMCNTPALAAVSSLTNESFTVSSHQPLNLVMGNAPTPIIAPSRFKWKPDKIHDYKAEMDSIDCNHFHELVSGICKTADTLNLKSGASIGNPWLEKQFQTKRKEVKHTLAHRRRIGRTPESCKDYFRAKHEFIKLIERSNNLIMRC